MPLTLFRHCLCVLGLLCLLVSFLLLTSCQSASGPGWKYSSFATDTEGLDVSANGIKARRVSQSAAFAKAADVVKGMWSNYLMAEGLKFLAGKYYDAKGAELGAQQAKDLEILRNAKSRDDAAAALERLRVEASLEAAAVAADAAPAAALAAP